MIVYVGRAEQVRTLGGEILLVDCALGLCPVRGLVSAASRRDLSLDRLLPSREPVQIDRVWYRRRREGYRGDYWYHDLARGSVCLQSGAVKAPAAEVCDLEPRNFICGG